MKKAHQTSFFLAMLLASAPSAQLNSQAIDGTWTVTVNGQSVTANSDGSFVISNIPVRDIDPRDSLSDAFVRLTGTSTTNGITRQVFTEPFQIRRGEIFKIKELTFEGPPLLKSVALAADRTDLLVGESIQLAVTGLLKDGSAVNVTPRANWTTYLTSNPRVATVGEDGLLTAQGRGTAFVTAQNDGAVAVMRFDIVSGKVRLRVSGIVRLPDGTPAASASIRIPQSGFEAAANLDGSFDLEVDAALGLTLSVVVAFESGGQQFSRTVELEIAEGLEQIDLGTLILREVQPAIDVFQQRVFEAEFPIAAASADLDGDGDPDLVGVGNAITVAVLLNEGDATFAPRIAYNLGFAGFLPSAAALGDLDGDGDADMAVVSANSNTISILSNLGDGAFSAPVQYSLVANGAGSSVALGDVDLDGDADLAVTAGATIFVLRNVGDGTFTAPVQYPLAEASPSVALGDVDLDGRSDLVAAVRSFAAIPANVSVLRNQGDGTFAARVEYALAPTVKSVVLSDLDGDDVLDIAAANTDAAAVLLNRGDGTFGAAVRYAVGASATSPGVPSSVAAGDLDGDGRADLAVANSASASISTLQNRDDGTFEPHVPYVVGAIPAAVLFDDFDGDGDRDVAVANSANLQILRNLGDGTLADPYVQYDVGPDPTSVALGDLDGDGTLDLAATAFTPQQTNLNNISVLRNDGGVFSSMVRHTAGSQPASVAIADLDGDGDADLAAANVGSNNISVLPNQGDGTFPGHVEYGVGTQPLFVALADLDGDGDPDAATANQVSRNVSILRNQGDATFAPEVRYAAGGEAYALTLGDLDGDGDADLAVVVANPQSFAILRNQGDGTFAARATSLVGRDPIFVALGDLDGDGDADVATANFTGGDDAAGTVSVLRNQGDGTFAPQVEYVAGTNPRSIALGDFDRDGGVDIAAANSSAAVSILRNLGDATFAAPVAFGVGANPWSLALGDIDGDGDSDLAVANNDAGSVSVLLNQSIR